MKNVLQNKRLARKVKNRFFSGQVIDSVRLFGRIIITITYIYFFPPFSLLDYLTRLLLLLTLQQSTRSCKTYASPPPLEFFTLLNPPIRSLRFVRRTNNSSDLCDTSTPQSSPITHVSSLRFVNCAPLFFLHIYPRLLSRSSRDSRSSGSQTQRSS